VEEIEPEAFSSSVNRSADIGKFHRPDGSTRSFGVLKSKPGFAIRGFNANNTYRSQGAAQFHDSDYQELFGDLSREFAETLFVDLDVETALNIAKERGYPTAEQRRPD
jgi:hypothetical protein